MDKSGSSRFQLSVVQLFGWAGAWRIHVLPEMSLWLRVNAQPFSVIFVGSGSSLHAGFDQQHGAAV